MARPRAVRTTPAKAEPKNVEEVVEEDVPEVEEVPAENPVEEVSDEISENPVENEVEGLPEASTSGIPAVHPKDAGELDERWGGPPKGIVLDGSESSEIPVDGNGIVQENVYRKVVPFRSKRPTYVLVARKGSRIVQSR